MPTKKRPSPASEKKADEAERTCVAIVDRADRGVCKACGTWTCEHLVTDAERATVETYRARMKP